MTTLKIALAQSPLRAAYVETPHGVVEVRGLMIDRHVGSTAQSSQQTWTGVMRYELLTNGVPQIIGSFTEIVEDFASHLRVNGCEVDWQPIYERVSVQPRHAPGVH